MNSLLVAGLFPLRCTAIISELCTEAERQGGITVVNAHHSNLLIWRTLGLTTHTALRLKTHTHTFKIENRLRENKEHRDTRQHARNRIGFTTSRVYRTAVIHQVTSTHQTKFNVYIATAYCVRRKRGEIELVRQETKVNICMKKYIYME